MPWCRQSFIDGSGDKAIKTLLAGNVFIDTVEEIRSDDGVK
jgi:hypothetical protein